MYFVDIRTHLGSLGLLKYPGFVYVFFLPRTPLINIKGRFFFSLVLKEGIPALVKKTEASIYMDVKSDI